MLHHKGTDKAKYYLDCLDTARCNGNWSEVPELVRKIGKHAPQRKCLQLTAQTEYQIIPSIHNKPSTDSSAPTRLSQLSSSLLSASQEAANNPEDVFQARVCLGWLHWTLNEPVLALQHIPVNLANAYTDLGHTEATISGWTRVCAVKGAYIRGDLQDDAGRYNDALRVYASTMPLIASTPPTSRSAPEYRIWAEQFLARYAILVHKSRQPTIGEGHSKSYAGEILAPLRAWAELARSNTSKTSNVGQFHKSRPTPKRQIWQLYYNTLSVLLQQALPYPAMGHGPSTAAQEMSTDNVKSVENLKLQQSIELRRVEGIYEDILLKEISFPKASEASVEVESWADQVMANWRVISGPSWQNEDLGRGGKDAVTRNVLAILYRAATRTFHSTCILRHLFTVHTALAEFGLAAKAFDTYIELVSKGKARIEKSGEDEVGLDDDATVLEATAAGLQMLCFYGQRKNVERAQEIAATLERWLERIQSGSRPRVSADDNPKDLQSTHERAGRSIHEEAIAAAYRSLGICRACWARLTYDVPSRPELQAQAVASFRAGLDLNLARSSRVEIHYALALILAETRDIGGAIASVKSAISLCTVDADEQTFDDQADVSGPAQGQETKILFQAWNLLAYLLSARQDFETAIASCDAAYDLYADLIENPGRNKPTEWLSLSEREHIIELKMSQLALFEVLDGSGETVNASEDLLSLYKQLFDYGEILKPSTAPSPSSLVKDTASAPPQSANGTVKSTRRSIFRRSRDAIAHVSHSGHSTNRGQHKLEGQGENAENPTISVQLDGQFDGQMSERRYQPPHHLALQESKKLHKRKSRKSMASDHRSHGVSTNRSSFVNGVDGTAQGHPSRIAEIQRSSMGSSHGDSSIATGHTSSEEVGVAVTHNIPSYRDRGPAQVQRSFPLNPQTTRPKDKNLSPKSSQPPPMLIPEPLPTSAASTFSLPDPIFSTSDLNRHALTLLVRIWLLIAQLYRNAAMPVDGQGALSEAFKHAKSIEAAVAATESSAQALSEPGWGKVRSVAEVWADVHAEQAALHLQLGNAPSASDEFEKALGWFPDHNAATVGLSNMLLDYYSQEQLRGAVEPPAEASEPKPMLASLPTMQPSQTESGSENDRSLEESTTLLSRLAARDRAYGLLSMLTKSGRGWDDSKAWFALARVYEESGQPEKAKEALWWVVELEEGKPVRDWSCIGGF